MEKTAQNLFKKGKWCPLFGALPRFDYHPSNSIRKHLIAAIFEARGVWRIDKPDVYLESCPEEHLFVWDIEKESFTDARKRAPQKSKLKRNWGISWPEIRSARLIYLTFMRGSMYSTSADIDPSQEKTWYIESRASGIAGVEIEIKGMRLLALLAICYAASALDDLLHRHRNEKDWLVLASLNEAQALMKRANDIMLNDVIERDIKQSQAQSKKVRDRHNKENPIFEERNEWLNKKAKALKEKRPELVKESIAHHLAKDIQTNPDYKWKQLLPNEPIGFESIRKIIDI